MPNEPLRILVVDDHPLGRNGLRKYALPDKRDPFTFKDYMTLEDIFRIPILHFTFHVEQIAR